MIQSIYSRIRHLIQLCREVEAIRQSTKRLEAYTRWISNVDVDKLSMQEVMDIKREQVDILNRASRGEDFDDIIQRRLKRVTE